MSSGAVASFRAQLTAWGVLSAWRVLASGLAVCPLLAAIRASGALSGPERDTALFKAGALLPLELVRKDASSLTGALEVSLLLLGVFCVLGLIPLASALNALAAEGSLASNITEGVRAFPGFALLSGITWLTQAAVLLGASIAGSLVTAAMPRGDERWATLTPLVLLAIGGILASFCGAALDVARVTLLQRRHGVRNALLDAITQVREHPSAIAIGCYPSVAGSLFVLAASAWLVGELDVSRISAVRIALVVVVHQAAVLLSVALRVRWLTSARVLVLAGANEPASD